MVAPREGARRGEEREMGRRETKGEGWSLGGRCGGSGGARDGEGVGTAGHVGGAADVGMGG